MVIGILICEVLEDEMSFLISQDTDFEKATIIETDPGTDLIADLRRRIEDRLTVIKEVGDFSPDPSVDLEILGLVLKVGLHMDKDLLRDTVKEQAKVLDQKSDVIILGYGLCGNVLYNIEELLTDMRAPIVMPQNEDGSKVDDCVCMVLGGTEKYLDQLIKVAGTWFVTPGWLKHWETLLVKELHAPDIETVKWIFEKATYKRVLMVDTGIGDRDKFRAETEKFAEMFNFYIEEVEGTLDMLRTSFDEAKNILKMKGKESEREENQPILATAVAKR